jgi:uncharacterized protein (DUF849 family)
VEEARENALKIEAVLANAVLEVPIVLHGADSTAWELLDEAIGRGHGIRIGFEDTLRLRNGNIASSNADLVREARGRIAALAAARA